VSADRIDVIPLESAETVPDARQPREPVTTWAISHPAKPCHRARRGHGSCKDGGTAERPPASPDRPGSRWTHEFAESGGLARQPAQLVHTPIR
jgi:hypothetical protein